MNRLQKKCVLATAGAHLLLLVILLVGPAFFQPRHQTDEQLHILEVIPANLIDARFNRGVRNAQPPAPVYHVPEPPAPEPKPKPKPEPVVTPRAPTPVPVRVVKPKIFKPVPPPRRHHEIKPNLKLVVRGEPQKVRDREDSERARALRDAIRSLKRSFSPRTMVEMPGSGTAAYANYADVIGSIYYEAWTPPNDTSSDDAIVRARIVVARDGTVISARILTPSGDRKVDDSVQRTLERVTFIAPFPEGVTEKERPFVIKFNLNTKRMLE